MKIPWITIAGTGDAHVAAFGRAPASCIDMASPAARNTPGGSPRIGADETVKRHMRRPVRSGIMTGHPFIRIKGY